MRILTYFSRITTTTNKCFEIFWSVTFTETKWSKGHGHSLVHYLCSKWALATSAWHYADAVIDRFSSSQNYNVPWAGFQTESKFRFSWMKLCRSDIHYILAPHVSSSAAVVYLVLRVESCFNMIDFGSLAFPWITQTFTIRETEVWNTNCRGNQSKPFGNVFSVLKTFLFQFLFQFCVGFSTSFLTSMS